MQNMHTLAKKHNIKVLNTHTQHAHIVREEVAVQNAVNAQHYTKQQLAQATQLKNKLTKLLNTTAYVNLRKRFIAIKLNNVTHKLTNANMQALFNITTHKVSLVFTTQRALIVRLN
jgi:hypothetical protein